MYTTHSKLADAILIPSQGDDSLSAENKPPDSALLIAAAKQPHASKNHEFPHDEEQEEEEEGHHFLEGHTALKFLLAGGVAGAGEFLPLECRGSPHSHSLQCHAVALHPSIG